MLRLPLAEHSMERVTVCNNASTNFRRKHSCLTAPFHAHFLNSHALSWCFNGNIQDEFVQDSPTLLNKATLSTRDQYGKRLS